MTEAEHLDLLCKNLMTKHGAKTLMEYAKGIANTLSTAERDRVLHLLETFENADVFLTKPSSVITAVLATAGSTRLISDSGKAMSHTPSRYHLLIRKTAQPRCSSKSCPRACSVQILPGDSACL